MVKTFYRRRNKLIPEDWTEEIEKWERIYLDKYFIELQKSKLEHEYREKEAQERRNLVLPIFLWERKKEEKRLLQDPNGRYCGHKKKSEMDNGMIVCLKCGRELGRRIGGSIGYGFRNHTMRGRKK